MSTGFVYAVQTVDKSFIKIGYTVDPVQRLRALRSEFRSPIEVIGVLSGTTADESVILDEFQHFAIPPKREYFQWHDSIPARLREIGFAPVSHRQFQGLGKQYTGNRQVLRVKTSVSVEEGLWAELGAEVAKDRRIDRSDAVEAGIRMWLEQRGASQLPDANLPAEDRVLVDTFRALLRADDDAAKLAIMAVELWAKQRAQEGK